MTPTPESSPAAPCAATQRPAGREARNARRALPAGLAHFFALDGWFRDVSPPGGRPDGYTSLCELFLAFLWFLAGCAAMLLGYLFWWGFYAIVPVAGWRLLHHWARTFYLRRNGDRWVRIEYTRIYAAAVRVFAAVWAVYLLATPWRPLAVEPPPADRLAAAEPEIPEEELPPDVLFACGYGPATIGRGTQQILDSRVLAFLFGDDREAQRRIVENRKAWWRVLRAAAPEDRPRLSAAASRADRAHLLLGRGGIPHLLDHVLFGSHQLVAYDGLVPMWWILFSEPPPAIGSR